MKKKTILNIATILLPLAVVAVAISPNSVTVISGTEIAYFTFAQAINGSPVGWCAPVALLLTYAMFGMSVIHMVTKKTLWMKLIRGVSFVGACLAACPILVKGDVMVIPNIAAGLLLMVLWVVSHIALKDKAKEPEKEAAPKGRRLSGK